MFSRLNNFENIFYYQEYILKQMKQLSNYNLYKKESEKEKLFSCFARENEELKRFGAKIKCMMFNLTEAHVDIFPLIIKNKSILTSYPKPSYFHARFLNQIDATWVFPPKISNFKGYNNVTLPIANQIEKVLSVEYGDNWKGTPSPDISYHDCRKLWNKNIMNSNLTQWRNNGMYFVRLIMLGTANSILSIMYCYLYKLQFCCSIIPNLEQIQIKTK